MATRGLMGFSKNGVKKVTYNHCDSYPSGLGVEIAKFIKETNTDELNKIFDRIKLVDENIPATQEQIDECKKYADTSVGSGRLEDWYCLLKKAQGTLSAYKEGLRYMLDGENYSSIEWEYIINLDTNELEIYASYEKKEAFIPLEDVNEDYIRDFEFEY